MTSVLHPLQNGFLQIPVQVLSGIVRTAGGCGFCNKILTLETDLGIDLGLNERQETIMTILLNTIFILFIGIWFVRFFVEMDVPEKYRVSRFFQNTTDYKGEGLTKKDVLRILFLAPARGPSRRPWPRPRSCA